MPNHEPARPIAVYTTIASDLLLTIVKFIVALIAGSSAMLAESIHSLADTGNQALILFGLRQSRRPADEVHPFGHGKDLYFWSLVVAIILFGVGGGMSIYEGITHLVNGGEKSNPLWSYIVLAVAFMGETISFVVSLRQLLKNKKPGENVWEAVHHSKSPETFIALGENTADILGLIAAFLGIFLSQLINSSVPDSIASIVIGFILAVIAVFLANESKSLLIGETADIDMVRDIRKQVIAHPDIEDARWPLTMHFGPDNILLALDVRFKPDTSAGDVVKAVDELESQIHDAYPEVGQIFIEIDGLGKRKHPHPDSFVLKN